MLSQINLIVCYGYLLMQYQGGGVVRLFHRESECYVSAEGSFALSSADIEDGMYLSILS